MSNGIDAISIPASRAQEFNEKMVDSMLNVMQQKWCHFLFNFEYCKNILKWYNVFIMNWLLIILTTISILLIATILMQSSNTDGASFGGDSFGGISTKKRGLENYYFRLQ